MIRTTHISFDKGFLCIISFLLFSVVSFSQEKSGKVDELLEKFSEYEFSDTTLAHQYLDSALQLADETADMNLLGEVYKNYGWFHQDWYRFYDAMKCFDIALGFYEKAGNQQGIADTYGNIGTVYADIGDYDKSIEYQQKSFILNEKLFLTEKDEAKIKRAKRGKANALGNLGNIYSSIRDYNKALEYQKMGMELEIGEGDNIGLAASYSNMGILYRKLDQPDKAVECHEKALVLYEKEKSFNNLGKVYNNLSLIKIDQNDLVEAEKYILKAIEYDFISDNSFNLTFSFNNYSEILFQKRNFQKALEYALKSYTIIIENGFTERLIYTNKLLYRIYVEMKNYEQALFHHTQYVLYEDSLFSVAKEKEMLRKSVLFDLEKDLIADSISRAKKNELVKLRHEQEIHQQRTYTFVGAGGFILMIIIALQLMRGNKRKQRTNKMLADKNEIITQKSIETEKQKLLIQVKQKEIVDSIQYAKRIQYALLAHDSFLKENLPGYFVLYEPKDIVSGDFYWATKRDNRFYLAVCDSTGHGVPGAFMSLLNISFLNEAVNEKGISSPDKILNHVRERLIQNIPDDARDGMDAILICIERNEDESVITYAAANNSPCVINHEQVEEYPADKMPVGKNIIMNPFSLHTLNLKKGDCLYLKTDGYADQFGGPNGKKFRNRNLLKLLEENHTKPLPEQRQILLETFMNWKGTLEQIDDICLIGIRI